jgi:DNA-binding transcriptional regulator YbjK
MREGTRRRRDPEARRREIVAAAAELIVEIGFDALTHRKVAARAGVPLGATTQYFGTLDDLREAALNEMRQTVIADRATPAGLARLVHQSLEDAQGVKTDRAVVTAAIHDPRVRDLASHWSDEAVGFMTPFHGPERARAAAVFLDGVIWYAQIHDQPLREDFIRDCLAALLTPPQASMPDAHAQASD